jgi:hypothetical protein
MCLLGNLMISVQDNDRYNNGWFTVNNVSARKSGDFCTKHRCFWGQGIIVVATGIGFGIGIGNGDSGNSGATKNRHIAPRGVPIYYGVVLETLFHAVMVSMRHAVMVSMT